VACQEDEKAGIWIGVGEDDGAGSKQKGGAKVEHDLEFNEEDKKRTEEKVHTKIAAHISLSNFYFSI
jgi:hypothetical protein